jgi:hypothetical protein
MGATATLDFRLVFPPFVNDAFEAATAARSTTPAMISTMTL